ncbi:hypothetical protein V7S43_001746 [Phytophthora oleae]|uniref:Serine protease n=1 Tax=Phytophthora oleae TaxID=2107226 RepID=A0ABD3G1F8_9STRA
MHPCSSSDVSSSFQLNGFGVEPATGESKRWLQSLEKCNRVICATGFVVDMEHGLILTNRHVVTPGPVVADAIFLNKEEVDLIFVYRDPVHDFGFYRFDPKKFKFLQLPEAAKIGAEIRVVGNDAGEKRLSRHGPDNTRLGQIRLDEHVASLS